MIVESKPVGPFAMNVYVVACPQTKHAAIIDSGGDLEWIESVVDKHSLDVRLLLQTHAHIDHIAGLEDTRRRWPDAPILMHQKDMPVYESASMAAMMFGIQLGKLPDIDRYIEDGERISLGELTFDVIFTPGHAPGHVVFHETSQATAFSGDLVFAGSIGRTDLPGCDKRDMAASLEHFKTLPPATRVLPGHGPETTVERELQSNPFLSGRIAL